MREHLTRGGRLVAAMAAVVTMTSMGLGAPPTGAAVAQTSSGPVLRAVRIGNDGTFDRVVFEFWGGDPGATLTGPVVNTGTVEADPSGDPIPVAGAQVVGVRMEPAVATYNVADFTDPPYSGPTSFSPTDTANVVQVVETGDFEAVLNWSIGLRTATKVTVTVLSDPVRVVVDVPHAASAAAPVDQTPGFTG